MSSPDERSSAQIAFEAAMTDDIANKRQTAFEGVLKDYPSISLLPTEVIEARNFNSTGRGFSNPVDKVAAVEAITGGIGKLLGDGTILIMTGTSDVQTSTQGFVAYRFEALKVAIDFMLEDLRCQKVVCLGDYSNMDPEDFKTYLPQLGRGFTVSGTEGVYTVAIVKGHEGKRNRFLEIMNAMPGLRNKFKTTNDIANVPSLLADLKLVKRKSPEA